nr:MAG TPA: hypothetical protein [Caudoviricetes sp.]
MYYFKKEENLQNDFTISRLEWLLKGFDSSCQSLSVKH